MLAIIYGVLCCFIVIGAGCTSNPTGPQGNPTPSILTVEFTGEAQLSLRSEFSSLIDSELLGFCGERSACQLTVSWSICTDDTYKSYSLFRSTNPNISQDPSGAQLLCVYTNRNQASYIDEDVIGSEHYYYALKTLNIADLESWSNEVDIVTPSGTPPTPSVLTDSTDATTAYLWWTLCPDADFTSYTVFRSLFPGIPSDTLSAYKVAFFDESGFTSYSDTSFYGVAAYYVVRTTNDFGLEAWSNEVHSVFRDSSIVAWGRNDYGQCDVSSPNSGFVAVSAGGRHCLGLKANGTLLAWGFNNNGQCDVPSIPGGYSIAAGGSSHSLGLLPDGSIVAWGSNSLGQCDIPDTGPYVAVGAGWLHSLGLKANGTLLAWGSNGYGQCDVPQLPAGYSAVAGGEYHSLGLSADGSIVAWGHNYYGQCDVPSPNAGFVAVAAGRQHSLGLKADGSIVAWGSNTYGQCDVPSPNAGFVAVAAGIEHSLGLKADGSIVAWGSNTYGQCDVPSPNTDYVAITAGDFCSMSIRVKL